MIPNNKIITKRPNGTTRVQTIPVGASRTQKQFKDQCNVNNIIAKFKKHGTITHVRNAQNGVYADLSELPSLQEAHSTINAAVAAFEAVPAEIRKRFAHDPQNFIDFLADSSNDEEAIKLGLKIKPKTTPPDPILSELQNLNKNLNKNQKTKPTSKE